MKIIHDADKGNSDTVQSRKTPSARAPTGTRNPTDTEYPDGWVPGFTPAPGKAPRTSRARRPPASTSPATVPLPTDPPDGSLNGSNSPPIKGLGSGESVVKTIKFDGDRWFVIKYDRGGQFRMVREIVKDGTVTLAQIIDGLIQCREIRMHVSVDRKTRRIGTEQISTSYKVTYTDNSSNYGAWTTPVSGEELNKDARPRWGFLNRLNLDAVVKSRKYPELVELIKAVNFDAQLTAPRVRVINQTGIVIINDVTHYANATGEVIGPDGKARTDVICEPDELDQYKSIGYSPIKDLSDDEQRAGLVALQDLLNGHTDLGITGIITGQLIGSLMSGTTFHDGSSVNSISVLVGPTETGKTAYAMSAFTSQTRTHHGEILPSIIARITPNKGSGGATPAGIYHKLKSYSGVFALFDDAIKGKWELRDKRDAHDKIIEKTTAFIIGGGTPQAQLAVRGVEGAPAMHLEMSGLFTVEDLGVTGSLMLDSTYNRMALIWWELEGRSTREVFERLITQENTLRRNNGLSVCLARMLQDSELLSEGYKIALEYLRPNLHSSRVIKSYARCLAGLHVLDKLCKIHKIPNHYPLNSVLPNALRHALMLESSGSDGGDEIAISDPVEATREAFRILVRVKRGAYATAPVSSRDIGNGVIPEPPELPDGQEMTVAGWFPNGEGWTYPSGGIKTGEIKKFPTNGRDSCPYPWRLECTAGEWSDLDTKLGEINRAYKHHVPTRQERLNALRNAGVLRSVPINGKTRHQIDWSWLTGLSEIDGADMSNENEGDE